MTSLSRAAVLPLALCAAAALSADDKKPAAKPVTDAEFVAKAASGGMFEVESSKVAVAAGQSAEVKKFAEKMIADHGKANKDLMAAAKAAGQSVPTAMDAAHQTMLDKVKGAKGAEFDKVYLDTQMKAHHEAVALFAGAAKSVRDPGLKAFAEKTLPVIQEHHDHLSKHAKGGKAP